jgi:isoleucyl-tRNA synthetase
MQDFKKIEGEIFRFWKNKKILEKVRKKNKGKKKFYFLDGPPYTSGKIHMGTAWNQVLKDQALRYKRMGGFDVWDRGGYDMHGLPTAHKIQEKYNLKDKKDIEEFGIGKFVKECKEFSIAMIQQMNKDFERLGVTLDHVDPYMPVTNEYMEGEWWLVKKAHEKKRLYQAEKAMTWCYKCETALAKHELEYKNITEDSIFVKFKVKGRDEYLLIWTTTPWTIAYNLGVMANPDLDYVRVKTENEIWILAKDLVAPVEEITGKKLKILETLKGSKLKGIEYIHPFYDSLKKHYDKIKKESEKAFSVVMSKEYVNLDAGTGLVHMAPGCGPEDYEVGRENKIPAFNNLTEKGDYPEDMGEFSGLNAKEDSEKFVNALEKRGALIATKRVEHDYAHCWRCKSPIIFKGAKQWFFKIEDLVPKMLEQSEKIKYTPKDTKKRYQLWIENLKDNSITRQRYWGTPLPIWKCECGDYIVVGSIKELKKLSGKIPKDLHRPWIDEITIRCKCGKQMKRIPDIIDVWVDAGTASWNCLKYPGETKYMKKFWPADLVLEASEQTRLWFYMLQLVSNIAMGKNCYNAMYVHGMIRDYKGVKMSKSLGNIISPEEALDKYGVDAMRLYSITNKAGEDMNFSWEEIKLKYKELSILLNITNYLNYTEKLPKSLPKKLNIEDRWILSRLNSTIEKATKLLDNNEFDQAPKLVEELFLDLSRKYIQTIRERSNDPVAFRVIYEVLFNILKMFSITCPYISEYSYLKLKKNFSLKEESIHLCKWPKADKKRIDEGLENKFDIVMQVIEKGLAERDKAKIGLRWPLKKITVHSIERRTVEDLSDIIKSQLNVKEVEILPNRKGYYKHHTYYNKGKEIVKENILVKLDTKITPELEAEGYAREMSRQVQEFRKKLGLQKKDLIELVIITDDKFKKVLQKQKKFLEERTNSKKLEIVTTAKERFKNKIGFKIRDKRGQISIKISH